MNRVTPHSKAAVIFQRPIWLN